VGQTLQADWGTWSNYVLLTGGSVEWFRCDGAGQNCALIPDAGGYGGGTAMQNGPEQYDRYTVRPDDVGSTIRVADRSRVAREPVVSRRGNQKGHLLAFSEAL
jgi:hypothetical protein